MFEKSDATGFNEKNSMKIRFIFIDKFKDD